MKFDIEFSIQFDCWVRALEICIDFISCVCLGSKQDYLSQRIAEVKNEISAVEIERREAEADAMSSTNDDENAQWQRRRTQQLNETEQFLRQKERIFLQQETHLRILFFLQRRQKDRKEGQEQENIKNLKAAGKIGTPVLREIQNDVVAEIEKDKLYFVNRDNAIEQLQMIHWSNFQRAAATNDGRNWILPLCVNIVGMGKSRLADNYIEHCRASFGSSLGATAEFFRKLGSALTVHVVFNVEELRDRDAFEEVLLRKLQTALIPRFKVAPVCLYTSYQRTSDFLETFIAEVGPLFIALDEIGDAFSVTGMNDTKRRKLFFEFCTKVLQGWFYVPGLFFFLLGRGSFLNFVGSHPRNQMFSTESPFTFQRLSLPLLRPRSIREIMEKTYVNSETLFNYYKLSEENAGEVAQHLFLQTMGNPRHLAIVFEECKTVEQLMKYVVQLEPKRHQEYVSYISNFKEEVVFLLDLAEKNNSVDLTQQISKRRKSISLEIIATNALIAWEGELEAAQLVISPTLISTMATYFFPLMRYLIYLRSVLNGPLNFSEAFELMLMKRIQELFSQPSYPNGVLPSFFDSPKFGNCHNLKVCSNVSLMPRIMPRGLGKSLKDETASPSSWPLLLKEMDVHDSLCLKPSPLSASPDVLFVGNVSIESRAYRYHIAIAANHYKTQAVQAIVAEECDKFNVMFTGSESKNPDHLNILIFCSTSYDSEMKLKFGNKKFCLLDTKDWVFIDEVIVLDLSSKENRAIFFGLTADDFLNETINIVISKTSAALLTLQTNE